MQPCSSVTDMRQRIKNDCGLSKMPDGIDNLSLALTVAGWWIFSSLSTWCPDHIWRGFTPNWHRGLAKRFHGARQSSGSEAEQNDAHSAFSHHGWGFVIVFFLVIIIGSRKTSKIRFLVKVPDTFYYFLFLPCALLYAKGVKHNHCDHLRAHFVSYYAWGNLHS